MSVFSWRRLAALSSLIGFTVSFALAQAAPSKPAAPAAQAPAKLGPGTYATFDTEKGKFVVQLFAKEAPKTVQGFVELAEGKRPFRDPYLHNISMAKFYDGLLFFRTVSDRMIQTGDPMNNGTSNSINTGVSLNGEKNNLKFDQPGRMGMAQGPDGGRSTQIFFVLGAAKVLDEQGYLVIGQIVQGMEVAKAISDGTHSKAEDIPDRPVKLLHVTIQEIK